MHLKTLSRAGAFCLLLLSQSIAWSAVLRSSDRAFSLDIPGEWVAEEPASSAVVLQVKNDHAEIKVRTLAQPLTETAVKAKLQDSQKQLKASGIVARKIYVINTAAGAKFSFMEFVSKDRRYQSGYFSLNGRTYWLVAADLTVTEFRAIPASLAALSGETGASEEPAVPGAEAVTEPATPMAGAGPGQSQLPAAPESAPGALDAPPAEDSFGNGGAPAADAELPPLPKRNIGGSLLLLIAAVLLSAAALGYRAYAGRDQETAEEAPVSGSLFPFHIERRYLAFNTVFEIKDAAGQEYMATSPRVPSLLLGTGIVLYFLLKATVQGILFAGVDLMTVPTFIVVVLTKLMSLSDLLIAAGAVLFFFFRKKMKLYDPSGSLVLDVCQKRFSFASQYFMIRDAAGTELARIKRVGFVLIRRRWQLLDPEGNVLLDIREDSAGRAIARKFLGHLWGLLRTNYIVFADSSEIGGIRREWSIWNRCNLRLAPPAGLEPRLALAAALFVDIVDPDRWHPWHG
jgi:uncharacterized protein YxjI